MRRSVGQTKTDHISKTFPILFDVMAQVGINENELSRQLVSRTTATKLAQYGVTQKM